MPSAARSIVFAGALFHDVGKPICTRAEADGSITSRGHSSRGASLIRQLFYRQFNVPLFCREAICALIRLHGFPLNFLNQRNPEREVILASLRTRCDWLALVALADVLGRECQDQQDLLTRVALFEELCREQLCLTQPRHFASDHGRFIYCTRGLSGPEYDAYNDTQFEAVVMSGLPAAGKSEWVRRNANGLKTICLDEIRAELDIDPADGQGSVAAAAKEQARSYARDGISFIWNATNISRHHRDGLIRFLSGYKARVRIVYIEAPYDAIVARNRNRTNPVPSVVIDRLVEKWEVPDLTEAHRIDWIM